MNLHATEQRVLGALMEKEMTTPDQYPLSLNALINACNQKSSREPVMQLLEEEVRTALSSLEADGLTSVLQDSRVARFEHRIRTVLQLRRDETAVLCLLLLRGAQTVGELRGRSDRLFSFDDLAQVQSTLERLAARVDPLTATASRTAGSREVRWRHLLGDDPLPASPPPAEAPGNSATLQSLQALVEDLQQRVTRLEAVRDDTD